MPRSGVEVASVELVDGTNLGRGRGRRMERIRDRKRNFGWRHVVRAGGGGVGRGRGPSRSRDVQRTERAGNVGGGGADEAQSERATCTASVRPDG